MEKDQEVRTRRVSVDDHLFAKCDAHINKLSALGELFKCRAESIYNGGKSETDRGIAEILGDAVEAFQKMFETHSEGICTCEGGRAPEDEGGAA